MTAFKAAVAAAIVLVFVIVALWIYVRRHWRD
jgi:hypothetical protein